MKHVGERLSGSDQKTSLRGDTGSDPRLLIAGRVADGPGSSKLNAKIGRRGQEHPGSGLAPRVRSSEAGDLALGRGPGGRVVDGLELDTCGAEDLSHAIVHGFNIAQRAKPLCDPALVRENDQRVPGLAEQATGLCHAREQADEGGVDKVAGRGRVGGRIAVGDQGVIAIEEDGAAHRCVQRSVASISSGGASMAWTDSGHRGLALALVAGVVAAALAWGWSGLRASRAIADARATLPSQARPGSDAIATRIAAMKLVTVELRTHVHSEVTQSGLFGGVAAAVTIPVRLLYGTDLARIDPTRVRLGPDGGVCVVRVPPPARIAVELDTFSEVASVERSWLAAWNKSGELSLAEARARAMLDAQRITPQQSERTDIRLRTREQVAKLVSAIIGERTVVVVRFEDEP